MTGALTSNLGGVRLAILARPQVHTIGVCSDSTGDNAGRSFLLHRLGDRCRRQLAGI